MQDQQIYWEHSYVSTYVWNIDVANFGELSCLPTYEEFIYFRTNDWAWSQISKCRNLWICMIIILVHMKLNCMGPYIENIFSSMYIGYQRILPIDDCRLNKSFSYMNAYIESFAYPSLDSVRIANKMKMNNLWDQSNYRYNGSFRPWNTSDSNRLSIYVTKSCRFGNAVSWKRAIIDLDIHRVWSSQTNTYRLRKYSIAFTARSTIKLPNWAGAMYYMAFILLSYARDDEKWQIHDP